MTEGKPMCRSANKMRPENDRKMKTTKHGIIEKDRIIEQLNEKKERQCR